MLSDSRFAQVIHTLRIADAYFFAEARSRRATHKPTCHAKQRAVRLKLKVDTDRAARLPINEVSTKPYPEIVQTYSPIAESNTYATTTWVTGPTISDLLHVNAALIRYLARTTQPMQEGACDRLIYPADDFEAHPIAQGPRPDVIPEAVSDQNVLATHSTSTSKSSSAVATPVRYGILVPLAIRLTRWLQEDRPRLPLKIHTNFKRKSCEVESSGVYVEKRPKVLYAPALPQSNLADFQVSTVERVGSLPSVGTAPPHRMTRCQIPLTLRISWSDSFHI